MHAREIPRVRFVYSIETGYKEKRGLCKSIVELVAALLTLRNGYSSSEILAVTRPVTRDVSSPVTASASQQARAAKPHILLDDLKAQPQYQPSPCPPCRHKQPLPHHKGLGFSLRLEKTDPDANVNSPLSTIMGYGTLVLPLNGRRLRVNLLGSGGGTLPGGHGPRHWDHKARA